MSLSNYFPALLLALAITVAAPSANALVKKPHSHAIKTTHSKGKPSAKKAKSKKSTQTTRKTKGKKGRHAKKVPYILAPKTPEVLSTKAPHEHHLSPEFSDALARGDLNQAYKTLQLEEASDKVGYLINQVLMAQGKGASHGAKISNFDRGTAWHNLYLFLQSEGRPAPKFAKMAIKYYQKAEHKPGNANRVNILIAALYASEKEASKSDRYFDKVDIATLTHNGDDYNGLEYLALYYAANQQTAKAIITLNQAYKLNPGPLLLWLHVGDDFEAIADDPTYKDQLAKWIAHHREQLAQLQRDKLTHDARKHAALESRHHKKRGKKGKKSGKPSHKKHR